MTEYLDKTGLARVWEKVSSKINELKTDVYELHSAAKITVSPTVFEKGVETEVTAKWTTTYKDEKITPVSTKLAISDSESLNETVVDNNSSKVSTCTDTTTFKVTSEIISGVTKTASASAKAVYPMYFGGNTANIIASTDVLAMTKQAIKASPAGTYSVAVTKGQYMWLCVPSGMTITKVTSSGFTVPMETAATVAVTGKGNYNCYRSSSTYVAGTVNIVIA